MGRCFYPLKSIPASGEIKAFVLHSHSGKTNHGYISLQFCIRGIKSNTPVQVGFVFFCYHSLAFSASSSPSSPSKLLICQSVYLSVLYICLSLSLPTLCDLPRSPCGSTRCWRELWWTSVAERRACTNNGGMDNYYRTLRSCWSNTPSWMDSTNCRELPCEFSGGTLVVIIMFILKGIDAW